jgi:hypothetical protein
MPIPTSFSASSGTQPTAWPPNSNPRDADAQWGNAVIVYVAKELTGGFVNHCHILGHEDRGMMHNMQATYSSGQWAKTGLVPPGATCDAAGFGPGDCQLGAPVPASPGCAAPPAQRSAWLGKVVARLSPPQASYRTQDNRRYATSTRSTERMTVGCLFYQRARERPTLNHALQR